MAELEQYCSQRALPQELVTKIKEHVSFQQQYSSAVSSSVLQVPLVRVRASVTLHRMRSAGDIRAASAGAPTVGAHAHRRGLQHHHGPA